jgi:hypothetical protein
LPSCTAQDCLAAARGVREDHDVDAADPHAQGDGRLRLVLLIAAGLALLSAAVTPRDRRARPGARPARAGGRECVADR